MKKLLSIMLAMAMVLSLVIVAAIPAAAIEGEWTVVSTADQENGVISEDVYNSVAGYEYDANGFHMTASNWKGQTPWARFVTKEKVDLKEGVYMEIVVDEFDYAAGDSWFNVMLTDTQYVTPGAPYVGDAVQNLIRPSVAIPNTTAWHLTGEFKQLPMQGYENVPVVKTADEKHTLTVDIAWDGATYTYTINGITAPKEVISYMNEKWGGDNSEVYVAFCLQHNAKDGVVAASLVKYGKSADTATVPAGDDHKDPIDNSVNHAPADLVENPTFEAGKPGIFMNGDVANSNVKDIPGPASGEAITPNEDGTMKVVAQNLSTSTGTWVVDNATSYAIEDLPVAMMVTRNLCTCTEEDKYDGICGAMEESTVYLMTGNQLSADDDCMTIASVSWDPYVIGDDTYLSVMLDATEMEHFTGRINAVRFDFKNIDTTTPGANTFDVCFVAFFATVDDAEAYLESYLTNLGWEDPDAGEDTTEAPDETTTGATEDVTTKAPEATTAKPEDEVTTAAPVDKNDDKKGGCGSVVGFGAIAIVAVASVAGFVSFKKKED